MFAFLFRVLKMKKRKERKKGKTFLFKFLIEYKCHQIIDALCTCSLKQKKTPF